MNYTGADKWETHYNWVEIGTPTMAVTGFYREKEHAVESGKKIMWWSVQGATTVIIMCISLLFTSAFLDSLYTKLLYNFCEVILEK